MIIKKKCNLHLRWQTIKQSFQFTGGLITKDKGSVMACVDAGPKGKNKVKVKKKNQELNE